MAEEKEEVQAEEPKKPPKKGGKKLLIIIPALSLVLGAGGFFGYKLLIDKGNGHDTQKEQHVEEGTTPIVPLSPFVLNLTNNKYLKVTIELELLDATREQAVEDKIPQLRDTIIMLVSNRPPRSVSTPEGKFQLKDEILLRTNQIMGMNKDTFKNIYFTEFVMQ